MASALSPMTFCCFADLLGLLALVELGGHLDQDFGVLGEIVVDDIDDRLLVERRRGSIDHARRHAPDDEEGGRGHERGNDGGHERGGEASLEGHAEISGG